MRSMIACVCLGLSISIAVGCTHTQLRWNTVRQSRTLTDIYEQQVLDNLAMFVYDPNSLPFFSFPNAGGSNVNDTGAVGGALNWAHGVGGLNSGALTLNGSRNVTESWTLTPIIDPVKLQLMRCAYQQAVANCGRGEMSVQCPDCEKMRREYLGRTTDQEEQKPGEHQCSLPGCQNCKPAEELPPSDQVKTADAPSHSTPDFSGAVDTDCMYGTCWIGFGCKKCVPKHCKCLKVGHYCGLYVWVRPGGQDELTKLTLNVLNYAYNDPTPRRSKEVTWELADSGCPISAAGGAAAADQNADASGGGGGKITVKATIPFNEPVVPFCGNCPQSNVNVFQRQWLKYGATGPSAIPGAGYLQFQQNQMNLTPQTR